MFKIDQAKSLFDCSLCNEMMVDPITLVCGYTICKSHLDKMIKDSTNKNNMFNCEMCNKRLWTEWDVVVIECIASVNHFSTYKRGVDFYRWGKVQKKENNGNGLDCKFYICFLFWFKDQRRRTGTNSQLHKTPPSPVLHKSAQTWAQSRVVDVVGAAVTTRPSKMVKTISTFLRDRQF